MNFEDQIFGTPMTEPFVKLKHKLEMDNIFPIYDYRGLNMMQLKNAKRVIYVDLAAKFIYPNNKIIDSLSVGVLHIETFQINDNRDIWIFDYK